MLTKALIDFTRLPKSRRATLLPLRNSISGTSQVNDEPQPPAFAPLTTIAEPLTTSDVHGSPFSRAHTRNQAHFLHCAFVNVPFEALEAAGTRQHERLGNSSLVLAGRRNIIQSVVVERS